MPSLASALSDLTFHALVLHDWSRRGYKAWNHDSPSGSITAAMGSLGVYLAPGALVLVTHADPLASGKWSELMTGSTSLPDDDDAESTSSETASSTSGSDTDPADDDTDHDEIRADSSTSLADMALVAGLLKPIVEPEVSTPARSIVLIGEDEDTTALIAGCIKKADAVNQTRTLSPPATQEAWDLAIGKALEDDGLGLPSFVFLAWSANDSFIGRKAVDNLCNLSRALAHHKERVEKVPGDVSLWIVTQGAYVGDINPGMGCIQGAYCAMAREMDMMQVKLIDMCAGAEAARHVASLITTCPREAVYAITGSTTPEDDIRVMRYMPVDLKTLGTRMIPADSPEIFKCVVPTSHATTQGQVSTSCVYGNLLHIIIVVNITIMLMTQRGLASPPCRSVLSSKRKMVGPQDLMRWSSMSTVKV